VVGLIKSYGTCAEKSRIPDNMESDRSFSFVGRREIRHMMSLAKNEFIATRQS